MKKWMVMTAFCLGMGNFLCWGQQNLADSKGPKAENFVSFVDGKPVGLFTLRNANGLETSITNYGARIVSLFVPDRYGNRSDIVNGFDSIADYLRYSQNFGATVGRYIGRILGAQFQIDSVTYQLSGGGRHCSHGGKPGFAKRAWTVVRQTADELELNYISPDGESGFPGTLDLTLKFILNANNELVLDYKATTDKPTVLNPSNHSFFNLTGRLDKPITNEWLWVDGDSITEYDPDKCVTGRFIPVDGTPFDFKTSRLIGERIDEPNDQLKVTGGYDHAWRLNHPGDVKCVSAVLYDKESGRVMEVLTTEPGIHIYTANGLKGNMPGKDGLVYPRRSSICFETLHFADSPNKPQFPSTLLRPGETFHSQTVFRFSVR